jgi:small-conductance mechanosensitive channel
MEAGQETEEGLRQALELAANAQENILLSVLAIVVVWAIRWLVLRLANQRIDEPRVRYQWGKGSGYVAFVLILVLLSQIWVEALRDMGTFLGLLTAGLAIALRDLVSNMAGWAFILFRHPFRVGDRVQVGENAGDVVDIRLFQFSLLEIGNWVAADQSTGRIIHVPNARVFSHPLANYTAEFPFVWHEIPVLITFESDWKRAREILLDLVTRETADVVENAQSAVKAASRKLYIHYGTLTPTVYTSADASGVLLTMRFISPARRRRGLHQAIWEGILEAFSAEDGIDLAYPTQRVYTNLLEGKPGARADLPDLSGLGSGPAEPGAMGGSGGMSGSGSDQRSGEAGGRTQK